MSARRRRRTKRRFRRDRRGRFLPAVRRKRKRGRNPLKPFIVRAKAGRRRLRWVRFAHTLSAARRSAQKALAREYPSGFRLTSVRPARKDPRRNPLLQIVGYPLSRTGNPWGSVAQGFAMGVGADVAGRAMRKAWGRNPLTKKESSDLLRRGRAFLREARKTPYNTREQEHLIARALEAFQIARDFGKAMRSRKVFPLGKFRGQLLAARARVEALPGPRRQSKWHRKSNPPRPGQKIVSERAMTVAEARRFPGFLAAAKGYKRFHGSAPSSVSLVRIADGQKQVTRRAVFAMGKAPEMTYKPLPGQKSNKTGATWVHRMGEHGGRKPLIVHDPRSGITSYLGGTYSVGTWVRR